MRRGRVELDVEAISRKSKLSTPLKKIERPVFARAGGDTDVSTRQGVFGGGVRRTPTPSWAGSLPPAV